MTPIEHSPEASEGLPTEAEEMDSRESALREIKDRIAAAMGELDRTAARIEEAEEHFRLWQAALELHRCADEIQRILVRVKPKG